MNPELKKFVTDFFKKLYLAMIGTQLAGTAPCQPSGSGPGPRSTGTVVSREAGNTPGTPVSGGITGTTDTGNIVTSSTPSA